MPYRSVTNSAVNSAGSHYAEKALLTVGLTSEELAEKIIHELSSFHRNKKLQITWEEFTKSAIKFI
jgi:hypothetical protein